MKTIYLTIIAALALTLFSCQSKEAKEKKEMITRIDTLEHIISRSSTDISYNKEPKEVIILYKKYSEEYKQDTLSPKFLFKAAEVQSGIGLNYEAIITLDTLINRYPTLKIIPSVLQFKAFILDDRLQHFDEARAVLDTLISKYPQSPLIENVKAYKETIGKAPEQIIAEMEAKLKKN